jgi:hypothetical protein
MKVSNIWGFLECLCFSGLSGGWDLLFGVLCNQDLLPDNGSYNCSSPGNASESWINGSDQETATKCGDNSVEGNATVLDPCISDVSGQGAIKPLLVPGVTSLLCFILVVPLGALFDKYGTLKSRFIAM